MQIIKTIAELRELNRYFQREGQAINFVPTMGNLHQGHIALVKEAKKIPGKTYTSIFVNPMQFNDPKDLEKYPRTMAEDIAKLEAAGCDVLFAPEVSEVYPAKAAGQSGLEQTKVIVPELGNKLEGASRPGHFDGVSTVVSKLFNLVPADNAIFGEKDFQQLMVIRQMVADLNIAVTIIAHPTVREDDGLAMSSRNGLLADKERALAPNLYAALLKIYDLIKATEMSFEDIQAEVSQWLDEQGLKTDYLFIANSHNLEQASRDNWQHKDLVILGAALLGGVRLIDNLPLKNA